MVLAYPAQVIVIRHTVSRKLSRNRRQAKLQMGSKVAVACDGPAFFRGEV
jgi:hypothetical protein